VAASLVNRVIRELLDGGYLEVVDTAVRPFAYRLTGTGRSYLRRLSHEHYRSVLDDFRAMQSRISRRLREIRGKNVHRLVFYGAGDVMEVTLPLAEGLGFDVVGVVDDDPDKHGRHRGGYPVAAPDCLGEQAPDGVLITTYRHAEEIRGRLDGRLPDGVRVLEL
jgi:hypothetical protein